MPLPSPRVAAYGLALVFALALACDLLWMPVQVGDSLGEIIDASHSSSAWASFTGALGTEAYLRPLRIYQIKALFDLAQGEHYWLVYRGFHALLAIAAIFLFVRALRVSTAIDAGAAAFALVVLIGLYTFRGTVREAFPINHFLEMVVLCLVALNLAQSRGGIWVDLGAALTFTVAALTLESGLLVFVVAAAAWLVGWRGISLRGVGLMTVLLLGYLYVRFFYLETGTPTLSERSAGYLLDVLEPSELQERFGDQPLWFYAYNVLSSIASVLFSEPQDGVFVVLASWRDETPMWRVAMPVVTSIATTLLLIWAAARRIPRSLPFRTAMRSQTGILYSLLGRIAVPGARSAPGQYWQPAKGEAPHASGYQGRALGRLDDTGRFVVVFLAVLAGNAVLSYAYAQDEIMSVAGAFYALAVFGAAREGLLKTAGMRVPATVAAAALLCVLATAWSVRVVGVHYVLRSQATKHQIDWVELPGRWQRDRRWPDDPAERRLILQLRDAAVQARLPNTRGGGPDWPDRTWLE